MRRRGRACALQVLYQLELSGDLSAGEVREPAVRSALARFWHNFESLGRDDEQFTERLVMGVAQSLGDLDRALTQCSRNWRLSRMDKVDLSILRLAAYELLHCPDVPRAASINEAVELAKLFSGTDSGGFINGLLDQLAPDKAEPVRPATTDDAADGGADSDAETDDNHPASRADVVSRQPSAADPLAASDAAEGL